MNYSEKLKDPRWQKKRLEILSRDNFKCQCCGSGEKELHVHHKQYSATGNPWDIGNWALISLCYECHNIEEWLKSQNRKSDLTHIQQSLVNDTIGQLIDFYYVGHQKELFDDLIEFFKSKDKKNLIGL